MLIPMDPFAKFNINGSSSGNKDSNDTIENTHALPGMATLRVGTQSSVLGLGDREPYRLIPCTRNSMFTGRKDIIELVKRLAEPKGHNRIALHGLGGCGKTQIALEYVHQRASKSNCNIFWVQGSGVLTFAEGFRGVAQLVQINFAGAETDKEAFLQSVKGWFEGPKSGDWVLVVDNADNEADFVSNGPLARFIPQGTKGTLIFTTRSRQVALGYGCKMVEVGKMLEEEAEELFSKRFGSWENLEDEEKNIAKKILGLMHHLPLAIVGAAAFMTETETPPSVYWSILQENEEQMKKLLSQKFSDIHPESDMTKSILGTYFVTFDQIRQQIRPAADLLYLMAFIDHRDIPEELLSKSGLKGMDDSIQFRRAIGKLLGLSLVTMVKHENKTFYELHRLVQLALQVYLPTEDLNRWRAAAVMAVSRLFPRDSNGRRHIGRVYIPHALSVTKGLTDPVAEDLCYRMGQYFLEMGIYNNAEEQVRRCIALREEGKEHDWDDKGDWRLMLLGLVNAHQGKYDEAEKIDRRALERCEKALGPDHRDSLTCANNLAMVLWHRGEYDESEKLNRHALEAREKVLGPDHPDTLTSVNTLATVLRAQGKYNEAEEMNRRALESCEKGFGPGHPDTLASVNNMACVLWKQGKYAESEKMYRRALVGYEKALGSDHPDTLASVTSLAVLLSGKGMHHQAERMNRLVLERYEKVLGQDHPHTLSSVSNLACVLWKQGKYSESEKLNRRAVEGREKVLGPNHPHSRTSICNLVMMLRRKRNYDESDMATPRTRKRLSAKPDRTSHDL